MNIEKKRLEGWSTGKGSIGHITLDKLAIPETVKVTLLGEPIIPESFNCYGHPNFTEEQEMLYMFKEEELKRLNGGGILRWKQKSFMKKEFSICREVCSIRLGALKSLCSASLT